MSSPRLIVRSFYLSMALALVSITSLLPLFTLTASAACVPPADPGPGVHHPVGADASLFVYNCNNNLYESSHYTYDPATGSTTPNDSPAYTYNPVSGHYDYYIWTYSAPANDYVQAPMSVATPPAGANVVGGPVASGGNSISNTGPGSNNTINNNGGVSNGASISNTGPNSTNTIGGTATSNTTQNNNNGSSVSNQLNAQANTGNSLVLGNTVAGGATSGDAQSMANIVNMLQSSSNALGGDTTTFVANIDGDVNGDLFLDPSMLGAIQPAGNTVGDNNLTINNQTNAAINNNINLAADSGDATVTGNTEGGDATSGSAKAIANVVNLINSAINSGKSFVGVININGNLNGDILIPPDFVNQLIATNVPTVTIDTTGPNSNNTINTNNGSNNTTVNNTNNLGINNNVNANANTGAAGVSNNTGAGNATSGNARTNITAFNLTGSDVIGSNDLLVFVNVLGTWVGMIVNAPGATAASLGGGITQNNASANNTTNVNNNTNQAINNNITTNANSGNANVTGNTKGGNAKTGDADSAVNLLNIQNSHLALSDWFGVLFINVFGTWHGSFGVNTSAGDRIAGGGMGGGSTVAAAAANTNSSGSGTTAIPQVFRFVPRGSGPADTSDASTFNVDPVTNAAASVLGSQSTKAPAAALAVHQRNMGKTALIIFTGVGLYILGDAWYTRRSA